MRVAGSDIEVLEPMYEEITLRELTPEEVTQQYVDWLNDPEINRYLESRFQTHTLDSVRAFVKEMLESESNILFGIFNGKEHVGNIKIGKINVAHKRADVGLMIGKQFWGKGFATKAIGKVGDVAFKQLKLHKIYAGAYSCNRGSINAFLKNGWKIVGEQKDHFIVDGQYVDGVLMEINDENI